MRKGWWPVVGVGLALALLVAGGWWWRSVQMTELQRALSWAPPDAQRLTFTDWAGVRRELGAELSAASDADAVSRFMTDAFDADLSAMSALPESTEAMHESLGFSPATLDWELLSQAETGAVVLMRLPEGTDMDAVAERLEGLGYERPAEDDGVWRGGRDLLPRIGTLTPELQYLAVAADRRLVVGSDTERYLDAALPAVTGGDGGVARLEPVAEASGEPLAAALYDGPVACSRLAMGSADPADQDRAERLVEAAGEVHPLTAFAMSAQPDATIRVVLGFETEEQARTDADTRSRLAVGPAPGQGGEFSDRFALGRVSAEDTLVTMRLEPREGSYVLSDLTTGPVLFATC